MKALKITFAMLSLLFLTVSGTSISTVDQNESTEVKKSTYEYDYISHVRKERTIESNS